MFRAWNYMENPETDKRIAKTPLVNIIVMIISSHKMLLQLPEITFDGTKVKRESST